jgi:hypothetical protein
MFKKNTAVVGFGIGNFVTVDGEVVITGTPTCKRIIDGTAGTCANAASYDATAGAWKINLAAADMNGDVIVLVFTLTDCLPISHTIKTESGEAIATTTGNWETAGTWQGGVVPSAGDNIIIRDGVAVTVAANSNLGQFGTLQLQGNGALVLGGGAEHTVVPRGWYVSLFASGSLIANYGEIYNSDGYLMQNYGIVHNNNYQLDINFRLVNKHAGYMTSNYGMIIITLASVSVQDNYGVMEYSFGDVETNHVGAIIVRNYGSCETNDGKIVDKFVFTGSRVHSISPPTSGMASSPGVFTFNLSVEAADPFIIEANITDDSPGVLVGDRLKTTHTCTETTTGTQWQVSAGVLSHDAGYTELTGDPPIVFTSSDESVSTVDASGAIHYVSDGICDIIGTSEAIGVSPSLAVRTAITNTSAVASQPVIYYTYADDPGSVRADATAAVDDRIAVAGKTKPIYSTQNHATATYVRSASCWASDIDLTCISPWNSCGANTRAGTLISPRHAVWANHYNIPNGSTIRFVDADDNVVTRTVVDSQQIGVYDIRIGVLDADVTGCSFAKILPADWADYLPYNGEGIPALVLDQEEKALVTDIAEIVSTNHWANFQVPTDATRLQFYEPIISGDSGNPAFLVIGGELVLLSVWTYGGAGSGKSIVAYASEIAAAMTALGGGYSPTEINLSGFNDYS